MIEENKDKYLSANDLGQRRKVKNTSYYKSGQANTSRAKSRTPKKESIYRARQVLTKDSKDGDNHLIKIDLD